MQQSNTHKKAEHTKSLALKMIGNVFFFFSRVGAQIPVDPRLSPYPCILVNTLLSDWSYN